MAPLFFFCILALDQLVKALVVHTMTLGESIPVISRVFHITYVLNPGAAFGLLEHQTGFFVSSAVIIVIASFYFYPRLKKESVFLRYGCVALVAGAMGNLIDRVRQGFVIDFLDFRVWPVFNIADIAIVLGVLSMVYAIIFKDEKAK